MVFQRKFVMQLPLQLSTEAKLQSTSAPIFPTIIINDRDINHSILAFTTFGIGIITYKCQGLNTFHNRQRIYVTIYLDRPIPDLIEFLKIFFLILIIKLHRARADCGRDKDVKETIVTVKLK